MKHSPFRTTQARSTLAIAALLVLGTAATACGSDDNTSAATTPAATSPAATTPAATEAGITLKTATSSLGTILVDSKGMTLYMFSPDKQGPSTCTGGCATAWPAMSGPATAGDGVDASLLATAARTDDGTQQVTYNGWPLYYFAQDAAPGDVKGEGSNGVWYVVDASGAPVDND